MDALLIANRQGDGGEAGRYLRIELVGDKGAARMDVVGLFNYEVAGLLECFRAKVRQESLRADDVGERL